MNKPAILVSALMVAMATVILYSFAVYPVEKSTTRAGISPTALSTPVSASSPIMTPLGIMATPTVRPSLPTTVPPPSPASGTPTARVLPTTVPTPTVEPQAESTEAQLARLIVPERDLYDMAKRLRGANVPPLSSTVATLQPEPPEGHQEVFWMSDMVNNTRYTTTATLKLRTPHAYFYQATGVESSRTEIERSASEFENRIFPTVTGYFGDKWLPGENGDARLTILMAPTSGVGGYFSASDEYPKSVNPFSNERDIIYVNASSARPGTSAFSALLSHEFLHAVHWRIDHDEQTWVSEGAAELASDLAGYPVGSAHSFFQNPDTQLTSWTESREEVHPHYGAAYLFIKYLALRTGGYSNLKNFMNTPGHGEKKIDKFLSDQGYKQGFDGIFKDWIVTNILDQPRQGQFGYPDLTAQVNSLDRVSTMGGFRKEKGHQYAARYFELQPAATDFRLQFRGSPQVSLLGNSPHSGRYQWWSNKLDNMDSSLTRDFDLTGISRATLRFWTWYDIEKDWDYAYVEVSADDGQTWTVLSSNGSSTRDPMGNSYGPGYTGTSGDGRQPLWTEEQVDLTPFAGKKIKLRFEYVTDESTPLTGFAVDDIEIPELGFRDDAENGAGWQARGFIRTDNQLSQRYAVRLVKVGRDVRVEDVPLDARQRGEVAVQGFKRDFDRLILVVAGMAPSTSEPAEFEFALSQN